MTPKELSDIRRKLKVYERHNQENAIDFVNYFVGKLPFRIHTIRTGHGHELQAKFHWSALIILTSVCARRG